MDSGRREKEDDDSIRKGKKRIEWNMRERGKEKGVIRANLDGTSLMTWMTCHS